MIVFNINIVSVNLNSKKNYFQNKIIYKRIQVYDCGNLVNPNIKNIENEIFLLKKNLYERISKFTPKSILENNIKQKEIELFHTKCLNNFSCWATSTEITIGYAPIRCYACHELFDLFGDHALKGFASLCCDAYNMCGECLANADEEMNEKYLKGDLCVSFSSRKNSKSHALTSGPHNLRLEKHRCMECSINEGRSIYYIESSHITKLNKKNSAIIEEKNKKYPERRVYYNNLFTTFSRQEAIKSYVMQTGRKLKYNDIDTLRLRFPIDKDVDRYI